jgi:hypothetical protein
MPSRTGDLSAPREYNHALICGRPQQADQSKKAITLTHLHHCSDLRAVIRAELDHLSPHVGGWRGSYDLAVDFARLKGLDEACGKENE